MQRKEQLNQPQQPLRQLHYRLVSCSSVTIVYLLVPLCSYAYMPLCVFVQYFLAFKSSKLNISAHVLYSQNPSQLSPCVVTHRRMFVMFPWLTKYFTLATPSTRTLTATIQLDPSYNGSAGMNLKLWQMASIFAIKCDGCRMPRGRGGETLFNLPLKSSFWLEFCSLKQIFEEDLILIYPAFYFQLHLFYVLHRQSFASQPVCERTTSRLAW